MSPDDVFPMPGALLVVRPRPVEDTIDQLVRVWSALPVFTRLGSLETMALCETDCPIFAGAIPEHDAFRIVVIHSGSLWDSFHTYDAIEFGRTFRVVSDIGSSEG